jgi:hypothetical protein
MTTADRVLERRRAAALARHYRDEEGLSIAEVARRLGRADATIKAYLYDPSYANKRPTDSPQVRQFWALAGHARTSICKRLLGSPCDGTRPAFPHYPICPIPTTSVPAAPLLLSCLQDSVARR